jgi:hypothetical protein
MKIKLSKFVGRDQLPRDKEAFDRISTAFDQTGKENQRKPGTTLYGRRDREPRNDKK